MTQSLTEEQHKVLTDALAQVGLKLKAAFGPAAIVIVVQSLEIDHFPGVISNLPQHATVQVMRYVVNSFAANITEHVVPMRPKDA